MLGLGSLAGPRTPSVTICNTASYAAARATSAANALQDLRRYTRQPLVTDPESLARLDSALAGLDHAWETYGDADGEIKLAVLDYLGRSIRLQGQAVFGDPRVPESRFGVLDEVVLRRRATEMLRRRLPALHGWLVLEVLARGEAQPLDRRVAACEVLARDQRPQTLLALFSATRSEAPELLDAAVAALAGRDLPEVHTRLIELLAQADAGRRPVWRDAIEAHFEAVSLDEAPEGLVERVRAYVAGALASGDWRKASRAVSIAHALPHEVAFPTLILGMQAWLALAEDPERPTRRVLGEIEAELRRRSGRKLGLHPERWQTLFEAFQRGEIQLVGARDATNHITEAGFFGLRPVTDRVVLVLDRSGSMGGAFGTSRQHSKLDEAAEQIVRFLEQLGPATRFGAVVFSQGATRWRSRLRPATPKNLQSVRSWVLTLGAEGGTELREGVELAMHLDAKGQVDLEKLEADTVIVLCDGATAEGPGWVLPLLRRVNDEARLVFHAVQIGAGGDGTLELLCEATGGEFVRVMP